MILQNLYLFTLYKYPTGITVLPEVKLLLRMCNCNDTMDTLPAKADVTLT